MHEHFVPPTETLEHRWGRVAGAVVRIQGAIGCVVQGNHEEKMIVVKIGMGFANTEEKIRALFDDQNIPTDQFTIESADRQNNHCQQLSEDAVTHHETIYAHLADIQNLLGFRGVRFPSPKNPAITIFLDESYKQDGAVPSDVRDFMQDKGIPFINEGSVGYDVQWEGALPPAPSHIIADDAV